MRNRRGGSNWWIWMIAAVIFLNAGGFSLLPLFIIVGVILATTGFSVSSYKKSEGSERNYRRTRYSGTQRTSGISAADMARVNIYLRKYFETNNSILLDNGTQLVCESDRYTSFGALQVYRNGSYISSAETFRRRYPDSYRQIIQSILRQSADAPVNRSGEVFEAEVKERPKEEARPAATKEEEFHTEAQKFMDQINELNGAIPDEEITNGLFETSALLKQIHSLETKFPSSRDKLQKLYEYYLPILTKILKQFETLQDAKTDDSYEQTKEKLNRTIRLINDAMRKIISSMTDQDFINLSADISTLEAVLQKDGLTDEGLMQTKSRTE